MGTIENNLSLIKNTSRGNFANCLKHINGLKSVLVSINRLALTNSEYDKVVTGCYTLKMGENKIYEAQTARFKATYSASRFKALFQMLAVSGAVQAASYQDLSVEERARRVRAYQMASKTGNYINYPRVWIIGDLSEARFDRIKGHKPLLLNYTAVECIFGKNTANQVFNDSSKSTDSLTGKLTFPNSPEYDIGLYVSRFPNGVVPITQVAKKIYKSNHYAKSLEYWQTTLRALIEYGVLSKTVTATSLASTGYTFKGAKQNTKVLQLVEGFSFDDKGDSVESGLSTVSPTTNKESFSNPTVPTDNNDGIKITDDMLPF